MNLLLALGVSVTYAGEPWELKTNLLYWATATPNAAIEFPVGSKHSLQLEGAVNPWEFSDGKQWKHWVAQAEYKYWTCEPFNGHFFGIHALGGQYNAGNVDLPFGLFPALENNRYQGWGIGGGLSYGYQWVVSRHFNIEASVGVGYVYLKYDKYQCDGCGSPTKSGRYNYVGPTKIALSFIYVLD